MSLDIISNVNFNLSTQLIYSSLSFGSFWNYLTTLFLFFSFWICWYIRIKDCYIFNVVIVKLKHNANVYVCIYFVTKCIESDLLSGLSIKICETQFPVVPLERIMYIGWLKKNCKSHMFMSWLIALKLNHILSKYTHLFNFIV